MITVGFALQDVALVTSVQVLDFARPDQSRARALARLKPQPPLPSTPGY